MVATYTEISKEDFEKFIKKIYRGYNPKELQKTNEYVYDLHLDENIVIRIYSSIYGHGSSAGVGKDAIRCVLFGTKINKPLNKKAGDAIVKRTQNWRHALMDRVYSFIEEYHHKKDFYDGLADGKNESNVGKEKYFAGGNTFPIKDKLRDLGFKWNPDHKKWIIDKKIDVSHLPITLEKFDG